MTMPRFRWRYAMPLIDKLVDRGWKLEALAAVLRDDRGTRPSRRALGGYLHRNPDLHRRWRAAVERRFGAAYGMRPPYPGKTLPFKEKRL
jgi:hypothetical protein